MAPPHQATALARELKPLPPRTISSAGVTERLRADILSGALGFGTRLKIDHLAMRYGVSHMPVREAIRLLQGECLLVVEPNRGARVREVNAEFVRGLYDMRVAIEAVLARRAAARITAAQMERLEAAEAALEAAAALGDGEGVLRHNAAFHAVIAEAGGTTDAAEFAERYRPVLTALIRQFGFPATRYPGVISDHRHIIAALHDRDGEAASTLITAHAIKGRHDLVAAMASARR